MTASAAERSKAAYIRRRGPGATTEQLEWLSRYEDEHGGPKSNYTRKKAADIIDHAPAPPHVAAPIEHEPAPSSHGDPWEGFAPRPDAGAPGAAIVAPRATTAGGCGVKDCPACRKNAGSLVCGSTGEKVWPRMTEDAANGMAASLLGVIAFAARLIWKKDIMPTQDEIKSMGRAIRESVYQRAGWLGADSDLFAVAFVLLSFGARVKDAPQIK